MRDHQIKEERSSGHENQNKREGGPEPVLGGSPSASLHYALIASPSNLKNSRSKSERSRPARRLFKLHAAIRIGLQDAACGAISAVRCTPEIAAVVAARILAMQLPAVSGYRRSIYAESLFPLRAFFGVRNI